MKSMRSLIGVVLAFALAAFALPTLAQGGPAKQFSLAFKPGTLNNGSNAGVMVRLKNETPSGNSTINSAEIELPAGYSVGGPVQFEPSYQGHIDAPVGAVRVKLSNLAPIKPGKFVYVKLTVNIDGSVANCAAESWGAAIWTGSSLSGDMFGRVSPSFMPTGYAVATSLGNPYQLSFNPQPTGAAYPSEGSPATLPDFGVTLTRSCGLSSDLGSVTVNTSLVGQNAGSNGALGGTTSQSLPVLGGHSTTNFTFSGLTITETGVYKISATATIGGVTTTATSSKFTIYGGTLECADGDPAPGEDGWFDASKDTADDISDVGFAAGYRGENKNGSECIPVNYSYVNNVGEENPAFNALGQTVPANGFSWLWDDVSQPNAVFRYTITWASEYVDSVTGLPSRKTQLCTNGTCTTTADMKACLGSALLPSSLPYVSGSEGPKVPACILSEVWVTDATSMDCLPPANGIMLDPPQACIRASTTVIDIGDPVFIR